MRIPAAAAADKIARIPRRVLIKVQTGRAKPTISGIMLRKVAD
jgi:hypothetical protein